MRILLLPLVLLSACVGSEPPGDAGAPAPVSGVDASSLCVSDACGERTVLLDIPAAENLIFADDGRFFVSSGAAVREIFKNEDGSFRGEIISSDSCNFTGLAIRAGFLYASCGDGTFWAGALTQPVQLNPIYTFNNMCLPNGTTLGPDGRIYVVDEPLDLCVPDPKIARLTLDPADPLRVIAEETWVQGSPLGQLHLGLNNVLRFPNGLQNDGTEFYSTDGGSVFRVDLLPDGSAGEVMPLFFTVGIHDDLGLVPGGILVADFLNGRIKLLSRDGQLLQQTGLQGFSSPTSVRLGRPPMFAPDDILVTETGVLGDQNLPIDYLSIFRRSSP